jgi:hypothetical protein
MIDDAECFFPQGVFIINDPVNSIKPGDNKLQIQGVDKFALLDGTLGGESDHIYIVEVGSTIGDIIRDLLHSDDEDIQMIIYDPIEPLIDVELDSVVTAYTIEKDEGTPLGEILIELADMVSANIYYNENGQLVFEQDMNDASKGSLYDFDEDTHVYIDLSNKFPYSKVYNAVHVIGMNDNGYIYDAIVNNTNAESPTSIQNVGFKRVKMVTDTNIYTDELALERARYELKQVTAVLNEQTLTAMPIYHLDVDKVITITSTEAELNHERYLIDSITLPLSTSGKMSLNVVRTV